MKKRSLIGYDFSVGYDAIDVDDIKDIHKYLMKKMIWHEYIKHNTIMFIKKLLMIHIKMGTVKQINIKNRSYYFYNDIIDLEDFDLSLLKLDKKSYKDIGI